MKKQAPASVVVVGALNLDMCGAATGVLRPHDSNPGHITLSAGGVGYNIARALAGSCLSVALIAMLGNDDAARLLQGYCAAENIDLRHAIRQDGPSSTYLCIHDTGGDMAVAINDMSLPEAFTPLLLQTRMDVVNAAQVVAADANLPGETLAMLSQKATVPIFLDPVSGFKAERASPFIGRFTAIKPNLLESQVLTGQQDPDAAADCLLSRGVTQVYISLGPSGLFYADAYTRGRVEAPDMVVPNANGAGDAMSAGIVYGMLKGLNTERCARNGQAWATNHLISQGGKIK